MNVSSPNRDDFYPPPELKNIVTAAENLKREFSMHWAGDVDPASYKRVMDNLEALQESLALHYKEFYAMEQALMAAASESFTGKQRRLLRWLNEDYREKTVYTVLIDRLSEDLGIPKSTVRWNLRGLREAGLIVAGDRENKGVPVGLTEMGRLMADYIASGRANAEHI